jgi:LmbE family N-acetylglucosaminyl deacetylase
MLSSVSRVLVLAPHTDDGEFGLGGTIARLTEYGKDVHYLAFSSCEISVPEGYPSDILVKELKAATTVLGIKPQNVYVQDFEVRTFDRVRQRILDLLVHMNHELRPDMVFMPSLNDLHQDHATVAAEAVRAFKRTSILAYEMPWNNITFTTQCFVPLEQRHMEKKLEAIACYKSQATRNYFGPDYHRAHLLTRGQQIQKDLAECFEVVRLVME